MDQVQIRVFEGRTARPPKTNLVTVVHQHCPMQTAGVWTALLIDAFELFLNKEVEFIRDTVEMAVMVE
jgi:hypothetical protein